jgi:hypothetical protein
MPPLPGRYGAYAAFQPNPPVPRYANGVINLDKIKRATVLGYIYGGIYPTVEETSGDPPVEPTQTGAANQVFQVTLLMAPSLRP